MEVSFQNSGVKHRLANNANFVPNLSPRTVEDYSEENMTDGFLLPIVTESETIGAVNRAAGGSTGSTAEDEFVM